MFVCLGRLRTAVLILSAIASVSLLCNGCGAANAQPLSGLKAPGEPPLCVLNHLKTSLPRDVVLGVTATAAKSVPLIRRESVVNTYENFYGGCNVFTKIAENDSKLLVYFDPADRNSGQQQRDTVNYLKRSKAFASIETKRLQTS